MDFNDFRNLGLEQLRFLFCKQEEQSTQMATSNKPTPPPVPEYAPVFVYGTLMPGFHNFERLINGKYGSIQSATVTGFQLIDLGAFPMAILSQANHSVRGNLIWIRRDAWPQVIASLDRLEGYPSFYDRALVRVVAIAKGTKQGEFINEEQEAYMYLAPHEKTNEYLKNFPIVRGGSWASRLADEKKENK